MDEPEYETTVNEPGLTCNSSSLASENRRVGDTETMPVGVGSAVLLSISEMLLAY